MPCQVNGGATALGTGLTQARQWARATELSTQLRVAAFCLLCWLLVRLSRLARAVVGCQCLSTVDATLLIRPCHAELHVFAMHTSTVPLIPRNAHGHVNSLGCTLHICRCHRGQRSSPSPYRPLHATSRPCNADEKPSCWCLRPSSANSYSSSSGHAVRVRVRPPLGADRCEAMSQYEQYSILSTCT